MAPIEPGAPPSALARQQADPANRLRRRKGTDATLAAPATASGATDATPEVNKGHSDQDAPLGKTPDGTGQSLRTHSRLAFGIVEAAVRTPAVEGPIGSC